MQVSHAARNAIAQSLVRHTSPSHPSIERKRERETRYERIVTADPVVLTDYELMEACTTAGLEGDTDREQAIRAEMDARSERRQAIEAAQRESERAQARADFAKDPDALYRAVDQNDLKEACRLLESFEDDAWAAGFAREYALLLTCSRQTRWADIAITLYPLRQFIESRRGTV